MRNCHKEIPTPLVKVSVTNKLYYKFIASRYRDDFERIAIGPNCQIVCSVKGGSFYCDDCDNNYCSGCRKDVLYAKF